jgi:uncharacterized membrane protein YphA (DoxX/SURF4 family)
MATTTWRSEGGKSGGFLLLLGSGPGRFSLDAVRERPRAVATGQSV